MSYARTTLTQFIRPRRRLVFSIAALSGLSSAYILPRLVPHIGSFIRAQSSMSTATPYKTTRYSPPADLLSQPLKPADFTRQDESTDSAFYDSPRFVEHIDDNAIASLTAYFDVFLPSPRPGAPAPRILDFCSSWISHYPRRLSDAAAAGDVQVFGAGMNAAELARNALLASGGRLVRDLNEAPAVTAAELGLVRAPGAAPREDEKLDALTCTVSIDYLTRPAEVLRSLRALTKAGGTVHLAVSNRCFPTKAVRRWLHADEDARLRFCCEDLARAGWREIEVVEVTDGGGGGGGQSSRLGGLMGMMGLSGGDPLWVVRGRNLGEG